jgi:CBS domain-containing protein
MDTEPVTIPAATTIDRALDEYFLRYRWPWFPVVDAGQRFLGLLNRGTADAVPETSRTSQTVSEILDPSGSSDQTVKSDEPIETLLANLELRRLGALAAVDADGRLAGVITLEQVGRALRDAAT